MPELVPFTMPSLGADMDAGTIVEWRIAPGSVVKRGDIVAEVETDKSNLDVEVFVDGTVVEIVVPTGLKVPVGTVLALLTPLLPSSGTDARPRSTAPMVEPTPVLAVEPTPVMAVEPTPVMAVEPVSHLTSPVIRHLAEQLHVDTEHVRGTGRGHRITRTDVERAARRRATPRARRLAREHGIDLETLEGTGIVTGDHVLRAVAPSPGPVLAPEPPSTTRDDAMRRAIARLMERSWREIPHYHVATRIDLHDPLGRLSDMNAQRSAANRILPAALLIHAAARAAASVPEVNGFWRDETFVPGDKVHVGVVVALRSGGLLAPVIHDAAGRSLEELMADLRDLVTRARAGRLRASEVGGATFTVTELGEGGVETVIPIIHPPQVAILGLGSVHDEPWAQSGMLSVRPVVHATLAGDHRAVDGRIGSTYLTTLTKCLREPINA